jgi:hypothetical protein
VIFLVFVATFVTLACLVVPLAILAVFAVAKRERPGRRTGGTETRRAGAQPTAPPPARRPGEATVVT